MRVGVVDYTVGNIGSVLNALRRAGAEPIVVKTPREAEDVDVLVLPGVGTYEAAYAKAQEFRQLVTEKPTLAICLGMQLLFESSEEGGGTGLGVFRGRVVKISARKIPHIGWSYTYSRSALVPSGYYYYLHSYGVVWNPDETSHIAYVELDGRYAAAVHREPVLGVQFHPERSGKLGISLLKTFLAASKR